MSVRTDPLYPKKWVSRADFKHALVALHGVSRDPNRTDLVGEFIGSLTGPSARRLFYKIWKDPEGRRVLQEGRDLSVTLGNRAYLASLPQGSLGRAYYDWTSSRDFTADGIADAISTQVPRRFDGPGSTMGARVVDMHDLWHVLNGWDSDIVGEIHLLGYSYAQLGAYAWLILGLLSNIALVLGGRYDGLRCLRHAIRRGRRAKLLAGVDWESLLPMPLEDVRHRLQIDPPIEYAKLRFEELHAMRTQAPAYRILRRFLPS